MFFRFILLVVSLLSFLCSFPVSSCDVNCADKPVFTPSRLVVKFGDPASASCSVCQHACLGNKFEVESPLGDSTTNGTTVSWRVDRLTEWGSSPICYYNNNITNDQCCTYLPITVYQPPDNVSISFVDLTGPMFEGHQYTLQCTVQHVAPIQNLRVTFYRGQTALGQRLSKNNTQTKPVTEIFTLNITTSKEDDGAQFWCEAKLELGPEGPQLPPVVMSQNITAIVLYKPQLASSHPDPITVTEGKPLQLNCSAVGNPTPSYTWTLPSAHLPPLHGSILTIKSVNSSDEEQYICYVSNSVGTVTVKFNVVVQGLTSTTLPPTTTPTTTTTSTTPTTTTKSTTTTTTTTIATMTTTVPDSSTSIQLHGFIMCLMLLFSALV